jgi:septal ring factor EnvC (AmiA/AmiB activator)
VDAATLGAVGTIVVGLAAAAAALIGHRGANAASQSGVVISGYGGLVDQLQEERDKLRDRVVENERLLAAAYAELASERADKASLHEQITALTAENTRLRDRIAELGGQPT